MPPVAERLAVVETEVRLIKQTTDEVKGDVKQLLAWRDEERGARKADRRTRVIFFTLATTLATMAMNAVLRIVVP